MEPYHLRRQDKAMDSAAAMDEVLLGARYVALAMCRGEEPYLVMLNHAYDPERRCLYFHCASHGKKIDFLRVNPRVWGVAVDDRGYLDGACDHAYRSVMFAGLAVFLSESADKRAALELMIRQQESDPAAVIAEQLTPGRVEAVTIGRVDITEISGKQAPPGES